jgi:hypothetical protein
MKRFPLKMLTLTCVVALASATAACSSDAGAGGGGGGGVADAGADAGGGVGGDDAGGGGGGADTAAETDMGGGEADMGGEMDMGGGEADMGGEEDAGQVVGSCALPTEFSDNLQRATDLWVLEAASGCDFGDGDGPKNKLHTVLTNPTIAGLVGGDPTALITDTLADGSVVLMMEAPDYATNGDKFDLSVLLGGLDASTDPCVVDADNTNGCKFEVDDASFDKSSDDATCPPLVTMKDVTADSGALMAGGIGTKLPLDLPISGFPLSLVLSDVSVTGTVADDAGWKTTSEGTICGVIGEDDVDKIVEGIPGECSDGSTCTSGADCASGPCSIAGLVDKAQIASLLPIVGLTPDVDTDGDGVADGISVGIGWTSAGAKADVTGVATGE